MTDVGIATLFAAMIALFAAVVAWGQWHTARQKLVLDLFETRHEAYQAFRAALADTRISGEPTLVQVFEVDRRAHEMRLLFGNDLVVLTREISDEVGVWRRAERRFQRAITDPDFANDVDPSEQALEAAQSRLSVLEKRLEPLIAPYLRMDQKLPRSPRQWLADAWRNRPDGTT